MIQYLKQKSMTYNVSALVNSNCYVMDVIRIFGLKHWFELSRQANLRFIIPFALTKLNVNWNTNTYIIHNYVTKLVKI